MSDNFTLRFTMKDGKRRFCNILCHRAFKEVCTCACGGMNHGVGSETALLNLSYLHDNKDSLGISSIFYRREQLNLDMPVWLDSLLFVHLLRSALRKP